MSTETVKTDGRVSAEHVGEIAPTEDDRLRKLARRHLEQVRRFRRYLAGYVLAMVVLTPVWVVTQYQTADGWPKHLSSRSRYPGDWDPWLIWAALVGAVIVAIAGYRAYFDRGVTDEEIEREVERLKAR